jgi:four helix bundle protein
LAVKIKSFQDLEIWKRSMKLVEEIYNLTKTFPKDEIYSLTSQLRRSAVSVPSNIAEGFARFHNKEYRQFLFMSLGSCAELTTQLIIASRLHYAPEKIIDAMIDETEQISKMTMSLIKRLTVTIN